MPSPAADPHDPLAGPSNPDAAGRSTPYGPFPGGQEEALGGADSSPLDTQSTDAAEPTAERLRGEGKRPGGDPASR
jgi:hypothetical protein